MSLSISQEMANVMLDATRSFGVVSNDELIVALGALTFGTFMALQGAKSERLANFDRWAVLVRDILEMGE